MQNVFGFKFSYAKTAATLRKPEFVTGQLSAAQPFIVTLNDGSKLESTFRDFSFLNRPNVPSYHAVTFTYAGRSTKPPVSAIAFI